MVCNLKIWYEVSSYNHTGSYTHIQTATMNLHFTATENIFILL